MISDFELDGYDKGGGDTVVFSHSDRGGCRRDGQGGATVLNGKTYFTPIGGIALKFTAGETLVRGEIVAVNATGAYMEAWKCAANADTPFGTVYDATATAGNPVWINVAGVGYCRPEVGASATIAHIAYVSNSERGRADNAATIPATEFHNREIGHYLESSSGNNEPARIVMHFN